MIGKLSWKKIVQYGIFLSIAFLFLGLASRGIPFEKMLAHVKKIHIWPLILIFIGGIGSHYFRALRWKMLIKPLGYEVQTKNTFLSIMIGYLINLVTPRMGEVARCGILSVYEKVPADKLAGTMIAERAFDLLTLLILFFLTFAVEYEAVRVFIHNNLSAPFQAMLSWSNLLILIAGIGLFVFMFFAFQKKTRNSENKIVAIFRNIIEGLVSIRRLEQPLLFLGYSAAIWILYWFMTYIGFWAFDDLGHLSLGTAMSVLSFGSIGFVLPAPGGMGSFQYFVSLTLQEMYHIEESLSLAYANVSWLAQTIVLITGGFISLILLPIVNRKKGEENAV